MLRRIITRHYAVAGCVLVLAAVLAGCSSGKPTTDLAANTGATPLSPTTPVTPAPTAQGGGAGASAVLPTGGFAAGQAPWPIMPIAPDAGLARTDAALTLPDAAGALDDDAGPGLDGAVVNAEAGKTGPSPSGPDAGPWRPPELHCNDGVWELAPGFLLAQPVDYVADRDFAATQPNDPGVMIVATGATRVLSSSGVPCANAHDRQACAAALALPSPVGRHLVTTHADTVKLWPLPAAHTLLGLIDTPAEALWWVSVNFGVALDCSVTVTRDNDVFTIGGVTNSFCSLSDGGVMDSHEVKVNEAGEFIQFQLCGTP